jgi:hypothetical protein
MVESLEKRGTFRELSGSWVKLFSEMMTNIARSPIQALGVVLLVIACASISIAQTNEVEYIPAGITHTHHDPHASLSSCGAEGWGYDPTPARGAPTQTGVLGWHAASPEKWRQTGANSSAQTLPNRPSQLLTKRHQTERGKFPSSCKCSGWRS